MPLRRAVEEARKKADTHGLRITGPHFSRKPFQPGTPQQVVQDYEDVERALLLINIVEKRMATGKTTDLAWALAEVDELQQALRLGAIVSIF
jgi:hypothetical protein